MSVNIIYALFYASTLAAELGNRKEYLLCSCGQRTVLNSLKDHLGPTPEKTCLSIEAVGTYPDWDLMYGTSFSVVQMPSCWSVGLSYQTADGTCFSTSISTLDVVLERSL